jgi:hypothetical protein
VAYDTAIGVVFFDEVVELGVSTDTEAVVYFRWDVVGSEQQEQGIFLLFSHTMTRASKADNHAIYS